MAHDEVLEGDTPTVPPVPTSVDSTAPAQQEVMGNVLSRVIQEGKESVPASPEPLVCKPRRLESWRVFKIMSEFVEGFELLAKYGLAVTVFGTARSNFEAHFYEECTKLSAELAKRGFAVITGGSAGVMEAANKGAYEAGGASIGLNIQLPNEQTTNKYLTDTMFFSHFFVRKVMLAFASEVYVFFPGGFGTLDEFFEILTLVQTKKIRPVPIVLYGKEYWDPLVAFMKAKMLDEHGAIDAADLNLFAVVDSVDEAVEYITKNVTC